MCVGCCNCALCLVIFILISSSFGVSVRLGFVCVPFLGRFHLHFEMCECQNIIMNTRQLIMLQTYGTFIKMTILCLPFVIKHMRGAKWLKIRHVSKVHKCPRPLVFAHMITSSGCINFNNYFPTAQSDLLSILIPSTTPGHDPGTTLAQS